MDVGRRRTRITKRLTRNLDRSRLQRALGDNPSIADSTFSVLDVETTGFGTEDQVIEIGLVRFTADGQAFDQWGTLINPGRDLRSYRVHKLGRFEYVRHAPTFEDIAGDLCQRLTGTVLAAHNLAFDHRMIGQEFERLGYVLPFMPSVCTLRVGRALGVPHRRLEDCCVQFGLTHSGQGHTALADAQAASKLLALYLVTLQSNGAKTLRDIGCEGEIPPPEAWPSISPSGFSYLREVHDGQPRSYLGKLVNRLPASGSEEELEYLSLLDMALEDFVLTPQEVKALYDHASRTLRPDQIQALHERYVSELVGAAWIDGVVTQEETKEICMVANLLGLSLLRVQRMIEEGNPQRG
mgnify:CR=1 FL=1